MIDERQIAVRWELVSGTLSERQRRLLAAAEARSQGAGGVSATARATGLVPDAEHRKRNWWPISCHGEAQARRLGDGRLQGSPRDFLCRTVRS